MHHTLLCRRQRRCRVRQRALLTAVIKAGESATDYTDFEPGVGHLLTPMINGELAKPPIPGDDVCGPEGLMKMGRTFCESIVGVRCALDALRAERQV